MNLKAKNKLAWFLCSNIEDVPPLLAGIDQPELFQDFQMVGSEILGKGKCFPDITNALFAVAQKTEDLDPVRFIDDL